MGTWGSGNFASDKAREHLDTIIDPLFALVWDFFARRIEDQELLEEDKDYFYTTVQSRNFDNGESKIMPTIDVLLTLSEHYRTSFTLRPETAEKWKRVYLQLFDDDIDGWGAKPDYKTERREVIAATFDKLIALTVEWDSRVGMDEPMRVKITAIKDHVDKGINIHFESDFGDGQAIWEGENVLEGRVYFVELDIPVKLKWGDDVTRIVNDNQVVAQVQDDAFNLWGKVKGIWGDDIGMRIGNTFLRITVPSHAATIDDLLRIRAKDLLLRDSKL